MPRWKKILLGLGLVAVVAVGAAVSYVVCVPAVIQYGVFLPHCPVGEVHPALELDVDNVRRGQFGQVRVEAFAWYTGGPTDRARTFVFPEVAPRLSLWRVGPGGDEEMSLELDEEHGWKKRRNASFAKVKLPADLLDGEYKLRAEADTRAGAVHVDAALSIYAPAKVHVITDRPLYEPGNTIQYRAVVLRARDLAPLDGRPGKWKIFDPGGELVLEEDAPAGAFGVVAGQLPLDAGARTGAWRVTWESAGASDTAVVQVEPFTLPRFTVEVASVKDYYAAGEAPRARVKVVYSSGVPVRDARLALSWSFGGQWPPPAAFEAALPESATTDREGRAELALPAVPGDIRGRVPINLRVDAVDPAGDAASGAGAVLLVEDRIQVSAVTELEAGGEPGLVEGFNNRAYLRATTASGAPLRGVRLRVKKAWDPGDDGLEVDTDESGVAALQIDPGPAVNVVVPPMPVRPPPPPDPVVRVSAREEISGRAPTLKDTVALDGWNPKLAPCARYVEGSENIELLLQVAADGAVRRVASTGAAADCAARVVRGLRLPGGRDRLLRLGYRLSSDLASLDFSAGGDPPGELLTAMRTAVFDARGCLGRLANEVSSPSLLLWAVEGRRVKLEVSADPEAKPPLLDGQKVGCVIERLRRWVDQVELAAGTPARFGFLRLNIEPVASVRAARPQATTFLGYELKIEAFSAPDDGEPESLGDTTLILKPGRVPALRARAEPVIAKAGEEVTFKLLRGPDFDGEFPEKVFLRHEKKTLEAELDEKTREARFPLPEGLDGWWTYEVLGARARVFVTPSATLDVELAPDKPVYRPGELAKLSVTTRSGGAGVAAAVGLIGVDETLGTLAPLPGPDALDGLRPTPTVRRRAFGALDAAALIRGQIRGPNARAATVLLVDRLPTYAELDVFVSGSARTELDPLPPLVDHFYDVLDELYGQVRAWESTAGADEKMTPERMVKLWGAALDAVKARGGEVTDVFGRELKLALLPEDLLSLVDPQVVVADGTRLPEDVENWVRWVRRDS